VRGSRAADAAWQIEQRFRGRPGVPARRTADVGPRYDNVERMGADDSSPTRLFRIVHIDNLASIVEASGIAAPNQPESAGARYVAIHNLSVQDRRAHTPVPCGPGGVVHDYVAFYFTSLSSMLYANHMGPTGDNAQGQAPIICLVAHAESLVASGARYVFTDGHAIMRLSNFYEDLADLDKVPWEVIEAPFWDDHPDGRRLRRQSSSCTASSRGGRSRESRSSTSRFSTESKRFSTVVSRSPIGHLCASYVVGIFDRFRGT